MTRKKLRTYLTLSLSLFIILATISIVIFLPSKPLSEKQMISLFNGKFEVGKPLYYYGFASMPVSPERPIHFKTTLMDKTVFYKNFIIDTDAFITGNETDKLSEYERDRFDTDYYSLYAFFYEATEINEDNFDYYSLLLEALIPDIEALDTKKDVFVMSVNTHKNNTSDYEKIYNFLYIDGEYYFSDFNCIYAIKKVSNETDFELTTSNPPNPVSPFIGSYKLSRLIDFIPNPSADSIEFVYGSSMIINSNILIFEDIFSRRFLPPINKKYSYHQVISNAEYEITPITKNFIHESSDEVVSNILEYFSIDEPLDESNSFIITVTNEGLKIPVYIYVINGRYYMHNESLKFEFVKKS